MSLLLNWTLTHNILVLPNTTQNSKVGQQYMGKLIKFNFMLLYSWGKQAATFHGHFNWKHRVFYSQLSLPIIRRHLYEAELFSILCVTCRVPFECWFFKRTYRLLKSQQNAIYCKVNHAGAAHCDSEVTQSGTQIEMSSDPQGKQLMFLLQSKCTKLFSTPLKNKVSLVHTYRLRHLTGCYSFWTEPWKACWHRPVYPNV